MNYGELGVVESLSAVEGLRAGVSGVDEPGKTGEVVVSCERVVGVVLMESWEAELHRLAPHKRGSLGVNTACCRRRWAEFGMHFSPALHLGSEGRMHWV